jgi:hypothetical protein
MSKLQIGDWVKVKAVTSMEYGDRNARLKSLITTPTEATGRIVGIVFRDEGVYDPGVRGSWFSEAEPASLKTTRRHMLYKVAVDMVSKPLEVALSDIERMDDESKALPFRKNAYPWTASDRDNQRNIMATYPRDPRGRWIKGPVGQIQG